MGTDPVGTVAAGLEAAGSAANAVEAADPAGVPCAGGWEVPTKSMLSGLNCCATRSGSRAV